MRATSGDGKQATRSHLHTRSDGQDVPSSACATSSAKSNEGHRDATRSIPCGCDDIGCARHRAAHAKMNLPTRQSVQWPAAFVRAVDNDSRK